MSSAKTKYQINFDQHFRQYTWDNWEKYATDQAINTLRSMQGRSAQFRCRRVCPFDYSIAHFLDMYEHRLARPIPLRSAPSALSSMYERVCISQYLADIEHLTPGGLRPLRETQHWLPCYEPEPSFSLPESWEDLWDDSITGRFPEAPAELVDPYGVILTEGILAGTRYLSHASKPFRNFFSETPLKNSRERSYRAQAEIRRWSPELEVQELDAGGKSYMALSYAEDMPPGYAVAVIHSPYGPVSARRKQHIPQRFYVLFGPSARGNSTCDILRVVAQAHGVETDIHTPDPTHMAASISKPTAVIQDNFHTLPGVSEVHAHVEMRLLELGCVLH